MTKQARIFIAAGILAAALSACGSDGSGDEQAGSGPPTTVLPAAQVAPPPGGGGPAAVAQPASATVSRADNDRFGKILVDSAGRTLYTFDRDTAGDGYESYTASACSGQCAQTWPPLVLPSGEARPTAGAGVTGLTTFPRDDGATQVAFNGRALYLYAGDARPGDVNGDGVGGVWHVAKA